jgi:putative transposase
MALAEIRSCDGGRCALRLRAGGCLLWADAPFRQGLTARKLTLGGRHIDACDREVMAWLATSTGISGEMLRDVMVACVERRFGISKAAHPVEWLSDNGSAYIAKETLDTATALGLKLRFTPVRSPESNGIAEAFVRLVTGPYALRRPLARPAIPRA